MPDKIVNMPGPPARGKNYWEGINHIKKYNKKIISDKNGFILAYGILLTYYLSFNELYKEKKKENNFFHYLY